MAEQRKPYVLVIGGGFAGRRAERMLRRNASLQTTLVDGGGFFEYTPAALRAMVHPAEALSTVIPQPPRATVAAVTGVEVVPAADGSGVPSVSAVTLSDGRRVPCDYVLFATGSSYAAPVKAAPSDWPTGMHGRHRHYRTCCTQLEAVTSALVIGGGTVGVELTAEIADKWRDAKKVTLVASTLLDRLPPAAGRAAASWLRRAGVDLVLGERVTDYGGADAAGWGVPGPYTVRTSSGRTLTAGAVFNCTGGKPLSAYLRSVPGALDAKGLIQCLPTMQLKALRNAFAAGDVADHGVEATAMNADLTAVVAARNIAACAAGGSAQQAVFPQGACFGASFAPDVQAVSLGKYNGVMVFNQLVLSGPPVAALKWTIEAMQLATARGFTLPTAVWGQLENLTVFMGTKLFRGRGRATAAAA